MNRLFTLILFLLLCPYFTSAQNIMFIDQSFKSAVIHNGADKDNDGEISYQEASTVFMLHIQNQGITSLMDINYFPSLNTLNASYNMISFIDPYSLPPNLIDINLSNNDLTEIDLSALSNLSSLNISWNNLTSVILPSSGPLFDLNVSNNQNLESINIKNNTSLLFIDLSNCPNLHTVCGWTLPFPASGVYVLIDGSPAITYTTDCCMEVQMNAFNATCSSGENGQINISYRQGETPSFYVLNNGIPQISSQFQNLSPGQYKVTARASTGCEVFDSVTVGFTYDAFPDLGTDTIVCSSTPLVLKTGKGFTDYKWFDNSTSPTVTVSSSGDYYVEVIESHGCVGQDTISVQVENCIETTASSGTCFEITKILEPGLTISYFEYDESGNIYVAGTFTGTVTIGSNTFMGSTNKRIYLAKYAANGDVIWSYAPNVTSSSDYLPYDLEIDNSGNIYFAGEGRDITYGTYQLGSGPNGTNSGTMHLVKFDTNGNIIWAKADGGGVRNGTGNTVRDLKLSKDGFLYASGYYLWSAFTYDSLSISLSTRENGDAFLMKIDPATGAGIWIRGFGGLGLEQASGIAFDSENNIYQGGWFGGSPSIRFSDGYVLSKGSMDMDYLIIKYSPDGQRLFTRSVPFMHSNASNLNEFIYVSVGPDDAIYAACTFSAATMAFNTVSAPNLHPDLNTLIRLDGFLVKYNTSLQAQKAISFGTNSLDFVSGMATDAAGDIYVTFNVNGSPLKFSQEAFTATEQGNATYLLKFSNTLDLTYSEAIYSTNGARLYNLSVDSNAYFVVNSSSQASGRTVGPLNNSAGFSILKASDKVIAGVTVSDQILCLSDTLFADAGANMYSYTWSDGSTNRVNYITKSGSYSVQTKARNACKVTSRLFMVNGTPEIELGDDVILFPGESVLLSPGNGYASYIWSTGATFAELLVESGDLPEPENIITVKVEDANGCWMIDSVKISSALVTGVTKRTHTLTVSPNPAKDFVLINTKQETVEVYDLQGKMVRELSVKNERSNVSGISPGIYLLKVEDEIIRLLIQ